jgi:hypothetical protein
MLISAAPLSTARTLSDCAAMNPAPVAGSAAGIVPVFTDDAWLDGAAGCAGGLDAGGWDAGGWDAGGWDAGGWDAGGWDVDEIGLVLLRVIGGVLDPPSPSVLGGAGEIPGTRLPGSSSALTPPAMAVAEIVQMMAMVRKNAAILRRILGALPILTFFLIDRTRGRRQIVTNPLLPSFSHSAARCQSPHQM